MAVMSEADRAAALREFGDHLNGAREPIAITKPALVAAFAAVDQWCSDNASSFNLAIPQPARSALTGPHKVRLLAVVARQRLIAGV